MPFFQHHLPNFLRMGLVFLVLCQICLLLTSFEKTCSSKLLKYRFMSLANHWCWCYLCLATNLCSQNVDLASNETHSGWRHYPMYPPESRCSLQVNICSKKAQRWRNVQEVILNLPMFVVVHGRRLCMVEWIIITAHPSTTTCFAWVHFSQERKPLQQVLHLYYHHLEILHPGFSA